MLKKTVTVTYYGYAFFLKMNLQRNSVKKPHQRQVNKNKTTKNNGSTYKKLNTPKVGTSGSLVWKRVRIQPIIIVLKCLERSAKY